MVCCLLCFVALVVFFYLFIFFVICWRAELLLIVCRVVFALCCAFCRLPTRADSCLMTVASCSLLVV